MARGIAVIQSISSHEQNLYPFFFISSGSFLRRHNRVTFHYGYLFLLKEIWEIFRKVKEDKSKDLIVQLPQLLSRDNSFL